ncbi:MAG: putative zinc-binding metallopeptidase [Candidatus Riflebacteria bacterium]|nr:putative zinc-binding metallopeptidase [Candidatus Riflebacteria bacterium]
MGTIRAVKGATGKDLVYGWDTVRYELLNTRVCDLRLRLEGSPIGRKVYRMYRELEAKGLSFRPPCYLSDSWGCPDRVPMIGIPFYLADERLSQIEEEETGDLEDDQEIMMLLRHEAGHAFNYGYRLYDDPAWIDAFGSFDSPYRETFRPNPYSRQYVRHINASHVGRCYAQKHPDEDFAETFAVWLTPRSAWRRRYRFWPAIAKLRFVDRTMRKLRDVKVLANGGKPDRSISEMDLLLIDHYGRRQERYRQAAQGYVDDILEEIFPADGPERTLVEVAPIIRTNRWELVTRVAHWTGLDEMNIYPLLTKMEERSKALGLKLRRALVNSKLLELTALITTLSMNYVHSGKFMVTKD